MTHLLPLTGEGNNLFDILQDILIITDSGKVIASKINNQHIEEHLFGMFISALSSFVEEISGEGLKNLEFTNLRIDLIKRDKFIFLATSSKRIKHKKARQMLERIINLFFERFPKESLEKWDGNLNIFEDLREYINKSRDEMIIDLIFKEKSN